MSFVRVYFFHIMTTRWRYLHHVSVGEVADDKLVKMASRVKVVFLHPDLGIGGAERLIVDAAIAVQKSGHDVTIVTTHHDEKHCFAETKDGTVQVTCVGDWLPRGVFGRCHAVCAYVRMIYAALYLVLFGSGDNRAVDLVVCDLVSVCIPVVRLFSRAPVVFYCHFPDQLLTDRKSVLKRLYRWPLDWLEEWTTGMADCVLVNSQFTAGVFCDTFRSLSITPEVLYPVQSLPEEDSGHDVRVRGLDIDIGGLGCLFMSINRYERKKNIGLAIEALAILKSRLISKDWSSVHLVVAGGYDERIAENKEYYKELSQLVANLELQEHVTFLRSFNDVEKHFLLLRSTCLIYTPDREHFGIVPIEAMHAGTPVIAVNSGGPTETILHEESGFLCLPTPEDFADAMERFVCDTNLSERMGAVGKRHVKNKFSFQAFQNSLNQIVTQLIK